MTNLNTLDTEIYEKVESCFDDSVISNSGNYIAISFGDKTVNVDYEHFLAFRKRIQALIQSETEKAEVRGMEKAKSRVLRRTEIPKDAKNPTRDAVVHLGEEIADIIQQDIDELQAQSGGE